MKTYSEINGKNNFDWNLFLIKAMEDNTTDVEREEALFFAGSWVTCAVGNQCSVIPRYSSDGQPIDEELTDLGMSFFSQIGRGVYDKAKETLDKIEIRSAQLINEINAKSNEKA